MAAVRCGLGGPIRRCHPIPINLVHQHRTTTNAPTTTIRSRSSASVGPDGRLGESGEREQGLRRENAAWTNKNQAENVQGSDSDSDNLVSRTKRPKTRDFQHATSHSAPPISNPQCHCRPWLMEEARGQYLVQKNSEHSLNTSTNYGSVFPLHCMRQSPGQSAAQR